MKTMNVRILTTVLFLIAALTGSGVSAEDGKQWNFGEDVFDPSRFRESLESSTPCMDFVYYQFSYGPLENSTDGLSDMTDMESYAMIVSPNGEVMLRHESSHFYVMGHDVVSRGFLSLYHFEIAESQLKNLKDLTVSLSPFGEQPDMTPSMLLNHPSPCRRMFGYAAATEKYISHGEFRDAEIDKVSAEMEVCLAFIRGRIDELDPVRKFDTGYGDPGWGDLTLPGVGFVTSVAYSVRTAIEEHHAINLDSVNMMYPMEQLNWKENPYLEWIYAEEQNTGNDQ